MTPYIRCLSNEEGNQIIAFSVEKRKSIALGKNRETETMHHKDRDWETSFENSDDGNCSDKSNQTKSRNTIYQNCCQSTVT
jgi:hypothetical protein